MVQPVLPRLPLAVALSAAALVLASCGVNERDPHRFEALAQSVASIPVSAEVEGQAASASSATPRQRAAPLKVELMTPHELWDAREGLVAKDGLGKVRRTSTAAPAASAYPDFEAPAPAVPTERPSMPTARHVQLGAFSSEEGARAAWSRLSRSTGGAALSGLQPAYEAVEVGGRRLVRLKVAATAEQAQILCRDLAASDPWCARSRGAAA
ncbi:SPOR domain-containing protein [Brevundimonas naejangsanensis]|uniref:SPOR domain-containing protein n=1 Tax=Brevundimonas naejangsanensis TaxID=588932 RepID=UPI0003F5DF22|nr:SPOR domain-containing protein [Brevundimonas naejangsanensis]